MLKNQKAFTLIELLVTLCVLGVLLSFALPSFKNQILNGEAKALEEDVASRINLARYEAIKRARKVSICASSDGATCTGNWKEGYIVFEDGAASDVDSDVTVGTVLKVYAKHDAKTVLDVKNDATAVTFMRFTSIGTLARIANSTNPLTIDAYITGCKGDNKRVFTIGISGLISVNRADCPAS